jgi:hypothetical protein
MLIFYTSIVSYQVPLHNLQRHQRLCKTCKVLDDEIHFFLQCQINNNLRNVLINNIKKYHVNFDQLDFFSQVKIILIPDQECLPSDYKAIVSIAKMKFTLVNA